MENVMDPKNLDLGELFEWPVASVVVQRLADATPIMLPGGEVFAAEPDGEFKFDRLTFGQRMQLFMAADDLAIRAKKFLEAVNEAWSKIEEPLREAMIDEGMKNFSADGRTVYLHTSIFGAAAETPGGGKADLPVVFRDAEYTVLNPDSLRPVFNEDGSMKVDEKGHIQYAADPVLEDAASPERLSMGIEYMTQAKELRRRAEALEAKAKGISLEAESRSKVPMKRSLAWMVKSTVNHNTLGAWVRELPVTATKEVMVPDELRGALAVFKKVELRTRGA